MRIEGRAPSVLSTGELGPGHGTPAVPRSGSGPGGTTNPDRQEPAVFSKLQGEAQSAQSSSRPEAQGLRQARQGCRRDHQPRAGAFWAQGFVNILDSEE